jgi:UDP-N-acetylmuramate dehydrogenase
VSEHAVIERAAALLGARAQRDVPLGPRTTYRVGGPAALFVEVDDEAALVAVRTAVAETQIDVLTVGKGSNLLVADAGFPGLAIAMGEGFAEIEIQGTTVHAGAAAALPVVARRTVAAGLTGFEWAVGVPGSIGGAVRMNAGGHGSDMAACLLGVRVVDLRTGEDGMVPASTLDLGYRRSAIEPHHLVVAAELALERGDPETGARLLSEIVAWRRANQPGGPNAGSVFTNPDGDSAGRLIDAAGGKGLRVGTAAVSTKHANFIQADEGGRADDVRVLMDALIERVRAATGVELHVETRCVGFDPPAPAAERDHNPRPEVEG